MKNIRIQFDLVLWDRLVGKGQKVTYWHRLEDAYNYVEQIEPGLRTVIYNGILHWEDGIHTLATVRSRIIDF